MEKHTWGLLNRCQGSGNFKNKQIYRCVTCDAIYIKKLNDDFLDDTQCSFNASERNYSKKTINISEFSGVRIATDEIQYINNGKLHRDDGPACILLFKEYMNMMPDVEKGMPPSLYRYWIDGEHIEGVESIEEAKIKRLLE